MTTVVAATPRRNKGIPGAAPQKAALIKTMPIAPPSDGAGVLKKPKRGARNKGVPLVEMIEALKA